MPPSPPQGAAVERADPRARRRAILYVAAAVAVALAALAVIELLGESWRPLVERELLQWVRNPTRGALLMLLMSTPLWGFAWYMARIARRVVQTERWPPPGQPVVRDTPILEGSSAVRRGRLLGVLSLLVALLPVACSVMFWRLLAAFASAA